MSEASIFILSLREYKNVFKKPGRRTILYQNARIQAAGRKHPDAKSPDGDSQMPNLTRPDEEVMGTV